MSSGRRSWWSWRSLFSSLGNGGGSNAEAPSGSGTSSSPPVPEAQQAAAGAARRRSSRTKMPREGPTEAEAEAEAKLSRSQPPPAPRKNRPSSPRKATPKAFKASMAKAQPQLGDGEPKKKPGPTPTPTQRNNKRKRAATFERSWSRADELRILEAMANHANTHRGSLPDTSDLFAALASSLDRRDADLPKLADKVHKLKRWYDNARLLQRCPTDDDKDDDDHDARRLFLLCGKVWGAPSTVLRRSPRQRHKVLVQEAAHQGNGQGVAANLTDHVSHRAAVALKENKVKNRGPVSKAPYVRRELAELSVLYPILAEEVKAHANECGELIRTAFQFIGDDEARHFDAKYRNMLMDNLNMKKEHADITRSLLCTLAGFIN